jgi:hypothetical protein
MMRFIVVALWLLSRTVAPAVTHPEAAAELLGAERPYALCLDVVRTANSDATSLPYRS